MTQGTATSGQVVEGLSGRLYPYDGHRDCGRCAFEDKGYVRATWRLVIVWKGRVYIGASYVCDEHRPRTEEEAQGVISVAERQEWTPVRIRKMRLLHGLSQSAFAQKLGVSVVSVVNWERGRFHPTIMVDRMSLEEMERQVLDHLDDSLEMTPERVRRIRLKLSLSAVLFADKIGVRPSTIWRWERRATYIHPCHLRALLEAERAGLRQPAEEGAPA